MWLSRVAWLGKTLYFSLKKLQLSDKVKVKWSYMGDSTNLYLPSPFSSIPLLCISTSFFFPHLNLMGIILRVFQGINLHRAFLDFYFLLSAIKIGGNCKDKDRRCSGWTRYCSYHKYVRANCKKTCKLC